MGGLCDKLWFIQCYHSFWENAGGVCGGLLLLTQLARAVDRNQ